MKKWIRIADTLYNLDKIEKVSFDIDDYSYTRYFITINNYKYEIDRKQFYELREYFFSLENFYEVSDNN